MKNSKKGISLIVLVITIIVIIILAAAVLLSINNNNPIDNANKAVVENDKAEVQSAVTLLMGSVMADIQQSAKLTATGMTETTPDVAIATGTASPYTYNVSVVTGDGKKVKYDETKKQYIVDDTATESVKLTADTLDIGGETLAKYKINANGKVSK